MATQVERGARRASRAPAMRRVGALAAALVLGAAACGSDDGDDAGVEIEATPTALAQAAQDSAAEKYHEITTVSAEGDPVVPAERRRQGNRYHTGATDGERYHATADGRAILAALAQPTAAAATSLAESEAIDQSLDVVGDGSSLYIRGPMLADLTDLAPPDAQLSPLDDLARLGDGWGRIDLEAFQDLLPADAPNVVRGIEGAGDVGRTFLGLLSDVGGVEELGVEEVHGTKTAGLAAEVSAAALFAATGNDPDAARTGTLDEATEGIVRRLNEITLPVEVWIGGDGLVRRMTVELNVEDIAAAMDEDPSQLADAFAAAGFGGLDLSYNTDYFDYGIPVPVRFPDSAIDITDAFAALASQARPPADS